MCVPYYMNTSTTNEDQTYQSFFFFFPSPPFSSSSSSSAALFYWSPKPTPLPLPSPASHPAHLLQIPIFQPPESLSFLSPFSPLHPTTWAFHSFFLSILYSYPPGPCVHPVVVVHTLLHVLDVVVNFVVSVHGEVVGLPTLVV